jgi:hypothetical protein
LNSIADTKDPGSTGSTGCDITGAVGTGTGTLSVHTGPGSYATVTRDSRNYIVQNNVWGSGSSAQTVTYNGVSFTVNSQTDSHDPHGNPNTPISYPSDFIGNNNGRSTNTTNLPKQISAMTTVPTGWSNNAGSISGVYNAAYDVWFNTSNSVTNNPTGGYLMVWLANQGTAQPVGQLIASGVSINSMSWNVWYGGPQNGVNVVSYVRTSNTTSMSFDLTVFIKDAVSRGYLQNSWYLTNIFAGFEIWSGGTGLKTNNFCAVVN